jgi:hypothetical protein
MTVEQSQVIDWLLMEAETGHVVLTIVDPLDWSAEGKHIFALQEKLNSYLAFIESGEIFERLDRELARHVPRSTPIRIDVVAKHQPPLRGREFFQHAQAVCKGAGFELSFKVVTLE